MKKRSAIAVARHKKPGRYAVGDGAYLQVGPDGARSWVFRYTRDGRQRHMGLGSAALISLAEAREKAREARRLLLAGVDPLQDRTARRRQAALEAAKVITFKECAERFIASNESAWRNAVHRKQWHSTLATYVYPVFGAVSVTAIDTALVTKAIEPIWTSKPETAGRVRGRIEAVLDWAKARGLRDDENPARWRGHLKHLLPDRRKVRRVEHHAALPWADLPAFMAELRGRHSISARALEFCILVAARTGEAIGATWAEIADEVWVIPPERMKAARAHRVPLCARALAILAELPREDRNSHLFPGARRGGLSNMAMAELLKGMRPGFTVHGFRSAFRDWAAESTGYPKEVVEAALAHAIESKVEAAYRRGDLFEKRRRIMAEWDAFCASPPAARGKVLPLRGTP